MVERGKRRPEYGEGKEDESAFWRIQRPFVGALIGIFLFLVILLPLKFLDYNSTLLYKLALNLELFGRLTILALGTASRINLPASAINLVSIVVSSIPAGIAGWHIVSLNPSTRMKGFIFLAGYVVFIYAFGALLAFAGI